jgi:hypothetical protein
MRDLMHAELKALRLYGMAGAWEELVAQGAAATICLPLAVEHLLASRAHRPGDALDPLPDARAASRCIGIWRVSTSSSQGGSKGLISELADLSFTEAAHNVVFIGGTGTGKTHLATALGVSGITQHGKRVRFYSTVDLVNAAGAGEGRGKAG